MTSAGVLGPFQCCCRSLPSSVGRTDLPNVRASFGLTGGSPLPRSKRGSLVASHPPYSSAPRPSSARVMASGEKESAANNPGLVDPVDPATKGYFLQQTMYRIRDPQVSLKFYSQVLGMRLLKRLDFPQASFTVYFMGFEDPANIPADPEENLKWFCRTPATLELTHNWGTECDEEFKGYHNGNTEPRGWGHIGVMVDDVYKACERFERLGVEFVKKPDEGKMKGLAFIKDPDGYWIEILAYPQFGSILATAS